MGLSLSHFSSTGVKGAEWGVEGGGATVENSDSTAQVLDDDRVDF